MDAVDGPVASGATRTSSRSSPRGGLRSTARVRLTGGHESAEDVLQRRWRKSLREMGGGSGGWRLLRRRVRRVPANTAISQSRRSFLRHEVDRPEVPDSVRASFEDGSDSHFLLWPLVCACRRASAPWSS